MDVMAIRRNLMTFNWTPQPGILVNWNQYAPLMNADGWKVYNASRASVSFSNGVGTVTYLDTSGTAYNSIRTSSTLPNASTHKYYVSYMLNPSASGGGKYGMEMCGRGTFIWAVKANQWTRISMIRASDKDTAAHLIIPYQYSPSATISVQVKSPYMIDLTQMFGSGNEPDLATFEAQCALNNIDLTQDMAYSSGTNMRWITGDATNLIDMSWSYGYPDPTTPSSPSTSRSWPSNVHYIGISNSGYYRHAYTNYVLNPSVSVSGISFSSGAATGYGIGFPISNFSANKLYLPSGTLNSNGTLQIIFFDSSGAYLETSTTASGSQALVIPPSTAASAMLIVTASKTNSDIIASNLIVSEAVV